MIVLSFKKCFTSNELDGSEIDAFLKKDSDDDDNLDIGYIHPDVQMKK